MDFDTQEQVLNYLGKKNDRNLIRRMLNDGRLYKEDGRYYLPEDGEAKLTVSNGAIEAIDNARLKLMEQDLEEAKAQWKYYEELAGKRAVLMEKVIHETYVIAKSKLGGKMEGEAEFRESIIRRAKGINED